MGHELLGMKPLWGAGCWVHGHVGYEAKARGTSLAAGDRVTHIAWAPMRHRFVHLFYVILGPSEVGFVIHFLLWTHGDDIFMVAELVLPFDCHPSLS